jgi:hypothetical protein
MEAGSSATPPVRATAYPTSTGLARSAALTAPPANWPTTLLSASPAPLSPTGSTGVQVPASPTPLAVGVSRGGRLLTCLQTPRRRRASPVNAPRLPSSKRLMWTTCVMPATLPALLAQWELTLNSALTASSLGSSGTWMPHRLTEPQSEPVCILVLSRDPIISTRRTTISPFGK